MNLVNGMTQRDEHNEDGLEAKANAWCSSNSHITNSSEVHTRAGSDENYCTVLLRLETMKLLRRLFALKDT